MTKRVWNRSSEGGFCSTTFNYVDVTLPAVSLLEAA
jgi:hypothetical protein